MANPANCDLENALLLAVTYHRGQVDKQGQPYILHPLELMYRLPAGPAQVVALLHDLVEDTPVTLEQLKAEGFSDQVVEAIDALSRRDAESYEAFIDRIAQNSLATHVKIEDLKHNLDVTRLSTIDNKTLARVQKYHHALQKLLSLGAPTVDLRF